MTKLEQLAALVAKQGAAVRATAAIGAGEAEVAKVVSEIDADVLAAAHNALPDLVAGLTLLAALDARHRAGRLTPLVAQRKAISALVARFA